jgi:hypothetical protein
MVSSRLGKLVLSLERTVVLLPDSPNQQPAGQTQALQVVPVPQQVEAQMVTSLPLPHALAEAIRPVSSWFRILPVAGSKAAKLRALRSSKLLPRAGLVGEARLALLLLLQVCSKGAMMASWSQVPQQLMPRALRLVSQELTVRRWVF